MSAGAKRRGEERNKKNSEQFQNLSSVASGGPWGDSCKACVVRERVATQQFGSLFGGAAA